MLPRRWFLLPFLCGALGFTGCSSGDEARCVQGITPAEVCITGSNGDLKIEASGLEPGSQFVYGSELTGESTVVAANGVPDAGIGFLGDFSGQTVSISATSESGEPFEGDVTIAE